MKTAEIKEKGIPELTKTLGERRSALRKLRFDIATKQVKNNREYRTIRKDIAKILTIIGEKNKEN